MEDEEVLLENDPLAIYLMKENIRDFETAKSTYEIENTVINKEIIATNQPYDFQELKIYFENILQSELLLQEDHAILESYRYSNATSNSNYLKTSILSTVTLASALFLKYINLKIILPICFVPLAYKIYEMIKRKLKLRRVSQLLFELNKLTSLIKKSLRIINEFSATIGYYSATTLQYSSINHVHIQFTKEFYSILLCVIRILAATTSKIGEAIPLNIENYINHDLNTELLIKSDINLSDLKLIFELYLLIQSDFIKTVGLSFCNYLWKSPHCDINVLLTKLIPMVTNLIQENFTQLHDKYTFLKNYEVKTSLNKSYKSPRKIKNTPFGYMSLCLHGTELYFQQLLCKARDLQNIMDEEEKTNENKTEIILNMLNEMEKQIISSKTMLDDLIKYFHQIRYKNGDSNEKISVQQAITNEPNTDIENIDNLVEPDKLVYELYIPKEGLDLTELEIERPVFSVKNLNYSGVLLEELRIILRARNPEMFQEETKPESESDDEKEWSSIRQSNIFRPTQPIGLAENLTSISSVLAARRNMMQNEDIFDVFEGSADEIG